MNVWDAGQYRVKFFRNMVLFRLILSDETRSALLFGNSQLWPVRLQNNAAIKAAFAPGVAGFAIAAHGYTGNQRILIAVGTQFDEGLDLSRCVALAP